MTFIFHLALCALFIHSTICLENVSHVTTVEFFPSVKPFIVAENVSNYETPEIVSVNCTVELEMLSEKISSFTVCAMLNSRPISVCKACVQQMNDTLSIYQRLQETPGLETCRQLYFGSDSLSIVDKLYNNVKALWSRSHCDRCYSDGSTVNYNVLSETTKQFFHARYQLDECISLPNTTLIQNSTCGRCGSLYYSLNDVYKKIVLENKDYDGVCMDIVDAMNITRHLWYDKYSCMHYDTSIGIPNVVTALLIGTMPLFFYILARNIAIIEDIKLVQPKRKSFRYLLNQH